MGLLIAINEIPGLQQFTKVSVESFETMVIEIAGGAFRVQKTRIGVFYKTIFLEHNPERTGNLAHALFVKYSDSAQKDTYLGRAWTSTEGIINPALRVFTVVAILSASSKEYISILNKEIKML